jgi:hypothetical protein
MERTARGLRKRMLVQWILFLILIAFSFNANAQWVSVVPAEVSAGWGLNKIRILSSGDGWAVGVDVANKRGVILQLKDHIWSAVNPPNVSSNWELNSLYVTSSNDAWDIWAVGVDYSIGSRQGIMLHYTNGLWKIFSPPYASLDWGLYDIFLTSSGEGWAVGTDYSRQKGILLHYKSGTWTSNTLPDLSLDWGLYGIHMVTSTYGWAVGVDRSGGTGALLHYAKDPANKSTTSKTYIWQTVASPQVDGDWELRNVCFNSDTETSTKLGWAVGVNHTDKRGVLLRYYNSDWVEISPPAVSSDWELNSVHFPSTAAGWAAGVDYAGKKAVMLQYDSKTWTVSSLPEVSSDWDLGSVRFITANDGWAAGTDLANQRGIILRYSTSNETISTPSTSSGPTDIAPNVSSTYYTGESISSLDHSVQYSFDWGDGTNSGWLPVGTVGATKTWTSPGTYQVKAQARCDTDTSEVSKLSSALSVTVSDTPTPITLLSPSDRTSYTGCSLYSLPTFTWKADSSFTGYEIQFSKTESFDAIVTSDKTSSTSVSVDKSLWKKVLAAPGSSGSGSSAPVSLGGPVFWKVVGTRSDKTAATSDTFSILIDPPQAVENLTITNSSKSSLPILSWDNQCNIKFKVWFGSNANFSKKTSVSFNITNPNDNGGVFGDSLNSSQWATVRQLVGKVSGSSIYWYVESKDGASRRIISQPAMRFILTD